ncbi:MAG: hypothetical protein JSU70_19570 [Phycisphaerales bacterium]|nr:MAG: hypothetical protein JSU70_19570 [Phycisphaerales bacterium]
MKKRDIVISLAIITGALLVFFLYRGKAGYVKIETPDVQMRLASGWAGSATISSGDAPAKLSARVYRPVHLDIVANQDGQRWALESSGPWGQLASIKVKNGETTVLKPGPPFTIQPKVNRRGSQVNVDFSIVGRAGEEYQKIVTKNGQRASAPAVKVIDEAGDVLASGKFAYG